MKKSILFVAAMIAACTMNAKVINIDLSKAEEIAYDECSAVPSCSDGVLTVNYSAGKWLWAGVELDLNNLTNVSAIDFDFKGESEVWVSFIVYLRDSEGMRWFDDTDDFSLSHADWFPVSGYLPTQPMWAAVAPEHAFGEKPFVKLGILANPSPEESINTTGTFSVRNVKIVADEATNVENVAVKEASVKVMRDGQMYIIRDGKTFNALGAEVK